MFETILVIFLIILLSNVAARFIPILSVPIIQVMMGAAMIMSNPHLHLNLDSHLFMLIFIGPLLFNDGMHANKRHLWHKRKAILAMAFSLVLITVLGIGVLIHALLPDLSLPISFALAAALSPTDYVAVSSLSKKIDLPASISPIIEGEGLINDATGLVSFKFALGAALSGVFSIWQAEVSFLVVAFGGIAVGSLIQLIIFKVENFISGLGMEDLAIEALLHLLSPFIIYFVSEEVFDFSGVLAVVAAGMLYTFLKKHHVSKNQKISEMTDNIWTVLVVILNGLVFTIVGINLPAIIREYLIYGRPLVRDMVNVIIISISLYVLRFLWVLFIYNGNLEKSGTKKHRVNTKEAVLTTLSGVRGAVTLATVLSVPVGLGKASGFPVRELLLFYAVGVIAITMLVATLLLPKLAKKDAAMEEGFNEKFRKSQIAVWKETIVELQHENNGNVYIQALISEYRSQIFKIKEAQTTFGAVLFTCREDRLLKLELLQLEKSHTEQLVRDGEVSIALGYSYIQVLERKMSLISKSSKYKAYAKKIGKSVGFFKTAAGAKRRDQIMQYHGLGYKNGQYLIGWLKDNLTAENAFLYKKYIQYYESTRILPNDMMKSQFNSREMKKYKVKSLQIERNTIQHFYEEGKINWNIASTLRKNLNYSEAEILRES
ncbi:MAG: sodium:proton antiporter [Turicibacter sp.]|nr:sodium:proton antiporter [Turicibacter sp.]